MNSINFSIGGDNSKFVAVMRNTQAVGMRVANRVHIQFGAMATAAGVFLGGAALRLAGYFSRLARATAGGVKEAYDLGGALSDLSARTGIAVGDLVVMQLAFKNAGVSEENLRNGVNKLQKGLVAAADGSKSARKNFSDLGVDWKALLALSPRAQFEAVGKAINDVEDPARRAAIAMKVFGRSGAEMLTVFSDGKGGFTSAARDIGGAADVLNKKSAIFDTISDKIENMVPAKMSGLFVGIADSLSEPLLALLEQIESSDLVSKGQEIGKWVIDAAQFAVDAFYKVQDYLLMGQEGMATMVGWAAEIANLLWDGFGRLGLISQALWQGAIYDSKMLVAGLTEGVVSMALDLQTALQFAFQHVVRFFDNAMGPVIDSIQAGLEYAVQKAMEGIAKIPILGKRLGLEGFKADTFENLRENKAFERQQRQSEKIKTYGEMRAENFNNSGWMKSTMGVVDSIKKSAEDNMKKGADALAGAFSQDRAKIFDPQIFYDTASELRAKRGNLASAPKISAMVSSMSTPPAKPRSGISAWNDLQSGQSSFQKLQSGKFGDRTNSVLGASPVLQSSSLILQSAEARRADKEREKAAQIEKDKDKTPEGTNNRLDDLISLVEEAWG